MNENQSFDPIWDEKYDQGFYQHAPWDAVVQAIFRQTPKDIPREEIKILEIACGSGSNICFAAGMGFDVTGIDASQKAVDLARRNFTGKGLAARIDWGDFTRLPYEEASFHMVIDRCGISHTGFGMAEKAIGEARRVLKPGGIFFWIPFSDRHSSAASGRQGDKEDAGRVYGGLRVDIDAGDIVGNGQACFYNQGDIQRMLPPDLWKLEIMEHMEYCNVLRPLRSVYAEWRVTARKI